MFKPYIHYDKELEGAILGACLIEKHAFARIRGLLTAECFYAEENRIIFETISEMWEFGFPIDTLTVTSKIMRSGKNMMKGQEILNPYHIVSLTNSVVSTANLEPHALIVRQLYAERELERIKHEFSEGGDVVEKAKKMQEELYRIIQIKTTDDWKDIADVIMELHEHMDAVKDKEIIGIPTGFSEFDYITSGLGKGQLIVVAARPSVGKSAFLGGLVINAARHDFKVGIISLEMSNVEVGARFGSLVSDVEFYKIFRNLMHDEKERDNVHAHLNSLAGLPIKISEKTNVNISDIRAKVSQLIAKDKLDILFVDYLQLVESEEGRNYNREQEVAKMSRGFKLMSREFNIPVIVLAQLNREAEKSASKKPQLHHLRESGAIEQDADGVIFLHRDWKSGILANEHGQTTEFEADLIIAKWRNGELKEIKIGFDPPKMKFFDLRNAYKKTNEVTYRDYTQPIKNDDGEDISNVY